MATPVQDQNLSSLSMALILRGRVMHPMWVRKGALLKEKALKGISIKGDLHAVKAKSSKAFKKGKVGGQKALNGLTNSVKSPSKSIPSTARKSDAVVEENIPCSDVDEMFLDEMGLHNHGECIKAKMEADCLDSFKRGVALSTGVPFKQLSPKRALQYSSILPETLKKRLGIEGMPEHKFVEQPESRKGLLSEVLEIFGEEHTTDIIPLKSP